MTSSKGCVSWKGTDVSNGETGFITVWHFDFDELKTKCPLHCEYITKPLKCQGHITTFLSELYERGKYLVNNVKHKNLVRYLAVNISFLFTTNKLKIQVVQEFIDGKSIRRISDDGKFPNHRQIGKEVLESIVYLQNKPTEILHGYLNDKSIFLDESGVWRVSDFELIPYLMYLKGKHNMHTENDVYALGNLIAQLKEIADKSTTDFIEKCQRGRVLQNSDLLKHPFLSNNSCCDRELQTNSNQSIKNFSIEKQLGRGSFGIVLKAKHELDQKPYALKIVEMPEDEHEYEKADRETDLISRINHKYIARHLTSWKEKNVNITEFRKLYDDICSNDGSMIYTASSELDYS